MTTVDELIKWLSGLPRTATVEVSDEEGDIRGIIDVTYSRGVVTIDVEPDPDDDDEPNVDEDEDE